MRALADVARTLGLGDYVLLGRGEESTGGRDKASILADTMEAVIGDGLPVVRACAAAATLVHHLLDPLMAASRPPSAPAWTGRPACRSSPPGHAQGVPEYRVDEEGPDHEKMFDAQAVVGDEVLGHRHRPRPRRKPSSRPPSWPGARSARERRAEAPADAAGRSSRRGRRGGLALLGEHPAYPRRHGAPLRCHA